MPPKPLPPHRRVAHTAPRPQPAAPRPQSAALAVAAAIRTQAAAPATPALVAGPSRSVGPHMAAQNAPPLQSVASVTPTVAAAPTATTVATRPHGAWNRLASLPIDIGREILRHLRPVDQHHLIEAADFGSWSQVNFAVLDITVEGATVTSWAWANMDLRRRDDRIYLVTRKRGQDQPVVSAFISARDVPLHHFVAAEAVVAANALPQVRFTLRRLDMHGETLFDVDALRTVMEELPYLEELRVANNSAILPDHFLDTFLSWSDLRVLDFRPADPRQHASGSMRTVSDQYSRYFLALAVAYIPIINQHHSNMLEPGSMFMDMLTAVLGVPDLDDIINACTTFQTDNTSSAVAPAYDEDDDGEDMGLADDGSGPSMVLDSPEYQASARDLARRVCVSNNPNFYRCDTHGLLPSICFSTADRKKSSTDESVSCRIEGLGRDWVSPLDAQVREFWLRLSTQFGRNQRLGRLPSMPAERRTDEEHVTPYPHNLDSWNDRKFPTELARIEGQPPVYDRDLPQNASLPSRLMSSYIPGASRPSHVSSTSAAASSPRVQIKEPSDRLAADEPLVKPSDTAAADVPMRNPISFPPRQDPFPQPVSKGEAPAQP
ncbi:uncharacterized protein M437DRAFT_84369, partial [Aureobasidium melanogenum CBS 110374]